MSSKFNENSKIIISSLFKNKPSETSAVLVLSMTVSFWLKSLVTITLQLPQSWPLVYTVHYTALVWLHTGYPFSQATQRIPLKTITSGSPMWRGAGVGRRSGRGQHTRREFEWPGNTVWPDSGSYLFTSSPIKYRSTPCELVVSKVNYNLSFSTSKITTKSNSIFKIITLETFLNS